MTASVEFGPYIALDIGGTKIAAGVVSPNQTSIENRASCPTDPQRGGAAVLESVLELASGVAHGAGTPLAGVAVASAGVVDRASGAIVSATDIMPGWAGTQLGAALAEKLGVPAFVLNDVHAHAMGEVSFGAGRGAKNAIVVGVGTGIGGAVVVDGQVLEGAHALAGHLGHIHHPLAASFLCSCGRYGHIESVASGTGVMDLYHSRIAAGAPRVSGGLELKQIADAGDELACQAFVDSGRALGEVLGSLANSFDPDVIILSGSMTGAGERWWDGLREGYAASAMNPVAGTPILNGTLGGDAPLLGAVAFAQAVRG